MKSLQKSKNHLTLKGKQQKPTNNLLNLLKMTIKFINVNTTNLG